MRKLRVPALSLAMIALSCFGQAFAAVPDLAVASGYLDRAAKFGFSGVVLVASGDEILLHRAYGAADIATGRPLTLHSRFYVASISKPITAAAVLRLVDQGRLRLDDSIARYLPETPDDKKTITLEQLLTHRSGLRDTRWKGSASHSSRDEFVAAALALPLAPDPGYAYSNTGYSLLAAIVERASGRAYAEFLHDEIFAPAGMVETTLVSGVPAGAELAVAANGDLRQGDAALASHRPFGWQEFGATGVVTTASDLQRFVRAVGGSAGGAGRAGRAELGWVVDTLRRGTKMIWHDGLLLPEGWNAQLRRYPDEALTVIVLANRTLEKPLGWVIARALDRALFGGELALPPGEIEPPAVSAWVGSYRVGAAGELRIRERGGRLSLEASGQEAVDAILSPGGSAVPAAAVPSRLGERTAAAGAIAVALCAGDADGLRRALGDDAGRWSERWSATRAELAGGVGDVGDCRSAAAIQSVVAADDGAYDESYVRFEFARRAATFRLIWQDQGLVGLSDAGAFVGEASDVAVAPGPVGLVGAGPHRLRGWSLARSTGFDLVAREGGGGLDVVRDGRATHAIRVD